MSATQLDETGPEQQEAAHRSGTLWQRLHDARALAPALVRELTDLVASASALPRALAVTGPAVERFAPAAGSPSPEPTGAAAASLGPRTIRTPVLLVHGYLGTTGPFRPLAARLQDAGFTDVYAFRYDTLSCAVPEAAAQLADAVQEVLARSGQDDVHLVGHSLGGIVVRCAVQLLGLDRVARGVVTVATPHDGSSFARFGAGPAVAQLRPGSAFLRSLPPLGAAGTVRWLDVRGGADVIVPASGSAVLDGQGHHSVLHCPALARAVVEHLTDHLADAVPAERRVA